MAWWMAAATIASTIAKSDADRKATRARKKTLDAAARDKLKAADSLLYANTINRSLAESRGRETQASQIAAFASSGVDITSGSVLDTLANTETQILRNDFLSKFKAQSDADLLKAQAGQMQEEGRAAVKNAKDRQFQDIVTGGLQAYAAYKD